MKSCVHNSVFHAIRVLFNLARWQLASGVASLATGEPDSHINNINNTPLQSPLEVLKLKVETLT